MATPMCGREVGRDLGFALCREADREFRGCSRRVRAQRGSVAGLAELAEHDNKVEGSATAQ